MNKQRLRVILPINRIFKNFPPPAPATVDPSIHCTLTFCLKCQSILIVKGQFKSNSPIMLSQITATEINLQIINRMLSPI